MARRPSSDPSYHDLVEHLKNDEPRPVYAIIGDEPFTRAQAIKVIRRAVLKDASEDMALSQYDGSDAPDPAELLDELRTPSFLAPRRLIIVEDAGQWASRADDALRKYLQAPSTSGVLLLSLKKLAKNTKLGKAVRKNGMVVACKQPKERDLPGWIARRARSHGKKMDGQAARRLAECVGVNLPIIDQNLAKLALYVGDRDIIRTDDIEALVEDLPVTTIFRLTDALGSRQPGKALRVLDTLLEQNHDASYILSMVRWAMERLVTTRTLLDQGASRDQIAKALRTRSDFFVKKTVEQAQRRSQAELLRGFDLLVQADLDTKTSAKAPRDTLEHLLVRLCE